MSFLKLSLKKANRLIDAIKEVSSESVTNRAKEIAAQILKEEKENAVSGWLYEQIK